MRYDWEPDRIGIAAGTIDEGSYRPRDFPRPCAHIFLAGKAGWFPLGVDDDDDDGVERFEGHAPEVQKMVDRWERDHAES